MLQLRRTVRVRNPVYTRDNNGRQVETRVDFKAKKEPIEKLIREKYLSNPMPSAFRTLKPTPAPPTHDQTLTHLETLTTRLVLAHNTLHSNPASLHFLRTHCSEDNRAIYECPLLPNATALEPYLASMQAAWKRWPPMRVWADNVTAVLEGGVGYG